MNEGHRSGVARRSPASSESEKQATFQFTLHHAFVIRLARQSAGYQSMTKLRRIALRCSFRGKRPSRKLGVLSAGRAQIGVRFHKKGESLCAARNKGAINPRVTASGVASLFPASNNANRARCISSFFQPRASTLNLTTVSSTVQFSSHAPTKKEMNVFDSTSCAYVTHVTRPSTVRAIIVQTCA